MCKYCDGVGVSGVGHRGPSVDLDGLLDVDPTLALSRKSLKVNWGC